MQRITSTKEEEECCDKQSRKGGRGILHKTQQKTIILFTSYYS
jgi:hypothetical protein